MVPEEKKTLVKTLDKLDKNDIFYVNVLLTTGVKTQQGITFFFVDEC